MRGQGSQIKTVEFAKAGLHFCGRYRNLVKYNPEFCGVCPYCGLKRPSDNASPSETCF